MKDAGNGGLIGSMMSAVSALLLVGCGCNIAGGISHERVVASLSRYVPESVARQIVEKDRRVPSDTLAELSEKWFVDSDDLTLLLLHPNFPQKRRSELIRKGRSAYYLRNAPSHGSLTDDDVAAMLESGDDREYILRETLECKGLSADTYRAVYRKWLSRVSGGGLRDSRFLVASANLPTDVRADLLRRLSGVPVAGFIIRENERLSGGQGSGETDVVEYMHVIDKWMVGVSFYVRCDALNGAGSLHEFIKAAKRYASVDELRKDVGGRRLLMVSDVGKCSMEFDVEPVR